LALVLREELDGESLLQGHGRVALEVRSGSGGYFCLNPLHLEIPIVNLDLDRVLNSLHVVLAGAQVVPIFDQLGAAGAALDQDFNLVVGPLVVHEELQQLVKLHVQETE